MEECKGEKKVDEKQGRMVDGFEFPSQEEAEKARQELEGVRYIKKKTKSDDINMILQMYNKMIAEELFETVIGISYLRELQINLRRSKAVNISDIKPIYSLGSRSASAGEFRPKNYKIGNKETSRFSAEKAPRNLRISIIGNVSLLLIIIAIFAITLISNRTTIFNYQKKIADQYAVWEKELTEREEQIRIKERELHIDQ
jgi:hypothetical protein